MYRRIMQLSLLICVVAGLRSPFASGQAQSAQYSPQVQHVIQFMRDRKHAFERGDAAAWGAHVADKCSFVEAGGRLSNKAQFSHLEPFVGYKFSAEVSDVRASDFGDTIVLTYREKDIRDFGVQRTEGTYIDTDTYARLNGDWQLVSFSENLRPSDPTIAKLDVRLYDKYVGTYEVNPEATFTVTREESHLFGQYAKDDKFELLPASKSRFFRRGDSAFYIFVWDKSGHVVVHEYRAEGVDVKYKKKGMGAERNPQ